MRPPSVLASLSSWASRSAKRGPAPLTRRWLSRRTGRVDGEAGEHLLVEIEDLRASRARLVAAADAERRAFEQQLHDGAQQQLVAVAVNLQLAGGLCETDATAARALLDEIGCDVRDALDGLRRLAAELYPPLLDAGGLVVALRSAAADSGIVTRVEAEAFPQGRPELATTVYFCCLEALRNAARYAGAGAKARVSIRVEEAALVFEIADDGCGYITGRPSTGGLRRIGDRVVALGGHLEIESLPGRGTSVSGSLPLTT
jgi:signal transduction histidine kinase